MGQYRGRLNERNNHEGYSAKESTFEQGKAEDNYYHWQFELDRARIVIRTDYIGEIVRREMAKSGATNKRLFLREKGLAIVCIWLNKEIRTVHVMVLKRFCKAFGIDPNELERKGIILGPCIFPVDMRSDTFIKLKTHVHNEGRVSSDAVSYINQDPVLIKYFLDAAKAIGMPITRELSLRSASIEAFTCIVLGRALKASGLPHGKKTRSNPSLDPILMTNTGLFRYHMRATFTEEGWFYISISVKDNRLVAQIGWGRSVDITDKLSNDQVEMLNKMVSGRKSRKIFIGFMKDVNIRMVIRDNPPLALFQEAALLRDVFIKELNRDEELQAIPSRIHVSKVGRITVFWEVHITRPELIDIIHDKFGMLPHTWKEKRFENLYETCKKYRRKRLSEEDKMEIRKVKKENPPKITARWVSDRMRELFPSVEWGADVEWIRKMLGRKENS